MPVTIVIGIIILPAILQVTANSNNVSMRWPACEDPG